MECFSSDKGVFLLTPYSDSSFMLRSLQSLLDIQPNSIISSFYNDKTYHGFRVYFEENVSTAILEKKFLVVSEETVKLFPLTTFLTIHDIFLGGNDSSQAILRNAIQKKFGNVLNLCPAQENSPSLLNRNWRAEIAVPEISNLDVFVRNGFPKMFITLPSKSMPFRITFWCRRCKEDGHIQQHCPLMLKSAKPESSQKERDSSGKDSRKNDTDKLPRENESNSFSNNNKRRPDIRNLLEPMESFARKLGKEEAMRTSVLLGENVNTSKNLGKPQMPDNRSSFINSPVKKELGDEPKNNEGIKNVKRRREEFQNQSDRAEYSTGSDITIKKEPNFEELQNEDTNSFYPIDDEIQIMCTVENNSRNYESEDSDGKRDSDLAIKASRNLKETYNRSSNPTSYNEGNSSAASSSAFATPSASVNVDGPSTSSVMTSSLSQRLQDCFTKAYNDYRVLDARQLDAFLIHVKKKSNPIRVAGNYTRDAGGLKSQLNQILFHYYNTPQTGTKEDIQFVKWLQGLVDRFDGTPARKRKRTK